jgi:hypothetical protein
MRKFFIFWLLSCLVFLWGCPGKDFDYTDSTITLLNNTDGDIMYYYKFVTWPDTSLDFYKPFEDKRQYELSILKAKSSKGEEDAWIRGFEREPTPIMLFFFSRDTIDQVPWPKIRDSYNILRRYDLTKAKLDSLNWTITYP